MKTSLYSLVISLLLTTFTASAQKRKSVSVDRFAGLDTTFARVLTDWKAVGFAVAVVEKDKVVYAKGFGYRDLEKKLPVTANTLFAIGSCTKAFTSSLIGLLQKDGKLEYDEPVTKYLPSLKFYSNDLTNSITVRDMMCHRTGLPRHDGSWYFSSSASGDSLLSRIQYMEPSAPLRQRWQYNNFMFLTQGLLTEKLTGKPWVANVQNRLLEPLGMHSTDFTVADMAKQADASLGYDVKKDSLIQKMPYYTIGGMGPAGSINSSITDMANWVSMWINGGKFKGNQILPASYVKEAISSQMVIAGALPEKEHPDVYLSNYGFGWFLASYKGHYRVEHGGNIDGFSASTCFFPTDSVGIIVLVNQNGSAVPSIVRNILADRMLHLPAYDWNKDRLTAVNKAKAAAKEAEKKAVSTRKKGTKPSHKLTDYAGTYIHEGYGKYIIRLTNDSLFLLTTTQKFWLDHYHYDTFRLFETAGGIDTTDQNPIRFQFTTNLAGDIDAIAITGLESSINKPLLFSRHIATKPISAGELKKYVGEYELAGITITTALQGGQTLVVMMPGQPDYELTYTGNHTFAIKKLSGYTVQFDINDKGEVTAMTSIQPNGNFKATRKTAKAVTASKN